MSHVIIILLWLVFSIWFDCYINTNEICGFAWRRHSLHVPAFLSLHLIPQPQEAQSWWLCFSYFCDWEYMAFIE